jgi:preprotein translocase subunit SecB
MQSALQLRSCNLERVNVAENRLYDQTTQILTGTIGIDISDPERTAAGEYELHLTVRVNPEEDKPERIPYVVEAACCGTFSLERDADDPEGADQLVRCNAPAILLGVIRTEIAQITGLGRFGPMWLPVMNLLTDTVQESSDEISEEAEAAR